MKHSHSRKSGFTLIEILIVLAIAAIISSIVFAAFKSINEGNKKTSCQSNLVQVYQALRLYGQDFNGQFPSYNPHLPNETNPTAAGGPVGGPPASGLGLWALYAYPKPGVTANNLDCDGITTQLPVTEATSTNEAPLASYIKSPRFFHCPYDSFEREVEANTECGVAIGTKLKTDVLDYKDGDDVSRFNPFYNSYQTTDAIQTGVRSQATYSSFRGSEVSRQLVYYKAGSPNEINPERRTPDTTVVTWCRFHRDLDRDGNTVNKASNSDNVLFMDGTVRYLPTTQRIGSSDCEAWRRVPQETVSSLTGCPDP